MKLTIAIQALLVSVSAACDWKCYLFTYPELMSAGIVTEANALDHFNTYGAPAGLYCPVTCASLLANPPLNAPISVACSWDCYALRYPDVYSDFQNPNTPSSATFPAHALAHYQKFGIPEGRNCRPPCDISMVPSFTPSASPIVVASTIPTLVPSSSPVMTIIPITSQGKVLKAIFEHHGFLYDDTKNECGQTGVYCNHKRQIVRFILNEITGNNDSFDLSCEETETDISTSFGDLPHLEILDFDNYAANGTIPIELFKLEKLGSLSIWKTCVTGWLPTEIGLMKELRYLYIANNYMKGPLPTELGNLSNLKVLELGNAYQKGTIPTELGKLTELEVLDLGSSYYTGTVPTTISQLVKVEYLYLDNNNLTGRIPSTLQFLTKLKTLELDDNKLTGTIPSQLGKLLYVNILRLEGNFLNGTIPTELGDLYLSTLNLEQNKLAGTIPTELGLVPTLKVLKLAENMLNGTIPSELGQLDILKEFHANNNTLTGTIPTQLANLVTLRELNLAFNSLKGNAEFLCTMNLLVQVVDRTVTLSCRQRM